MNRLTLYNIADEALALEEMLMNDEGELTDESCELETYISDLMISKTDSIVHVANKLEDEIELAKKHIDRLSGFKRARENAVQRMKEYSLLCLEKMNKDKVAGEIAEIATRKPVKVLDIIDENKIPGEFVTVETVVKIDKKALLAAIKKGLDCEGAGIKDGAKSVQFKLKRVK